MTALIHQQLELAAVNAFSDTIRQAKLRESNAERIGKLERNYREYTAELRRRYSLGEIARRGSHSKAASHATTSGFAFVPYVPLLGFVRWAPNRSGNVSPQTAS